MSTRYYNTCFVEFACVSRQACGLSPAELLRIAQQAWVFNNRNGITGELRFDRGGFMQVLEGTCEVILPLVARILSDRRHKAISVLAFRPIAVRRFDAWRTSGFVHAGREGADFVDTFNLHMLREHPACQSEAVCPSETGVAGSALSGRNH